MSYSIAVAVAIVAAYSSNRNGIFALGVCGGLVIVAENASRSLKHEHTHRDLIFMAAYTQHEQQQPPQQQ